MEVSLNVVILAAGSGSRIGQPKIYLKIGEKYFLDYICDNLLLAGLKNIYTIIAEEFDTTLFKHRDDMNWIINPYPERGMISSVYWGINNSPTASGYMMVPVDHPVILRKTFNTLYNVFIENPDCVIIAAFNNMLGHPVIIPRSLAEKIENKDYPDGLRTIIRNPGVKIITVETDDQGILQNINTKEYLENLF